MHLIYTTHSKAELNNICIQVTIWIFTLAFLIEFPNKEFKSGVLSKKWISLGETFTWDKSVEVHLISRCQTFNCVQPLASLCISTLHAPLICTASFSSASIPISSATRAGPSPFSADPFQHD